MTQDELLRLQPVEGLESSFSSAEDVILMKMEFFRRGSSDKHLRDIAGILKLSGDQLDLEYIDRRSAVEDLMIMARTMPVMVFRKGSM